MFFLPGVHFIDERRVDDFGIPNPDAHGFVIIDLDRIQVLPEKFWEIIAFF